MRSCAVLFGTIKLNNKQQVPFIVMLCSTLERVKEKRVQIPHDLVTVIREPAAIMWQHIGH